MCSPAKRMQSGIIAADIYSDQYIKWMEQFNHFDLNHSQTNKIYWDYLNRAGLCIDFVGGYSCGDHTEQHPLRNGVVYRPAHKYACFQDFEFIGHGGDANFIKDFGYVLREKLEQLTKHSPDCDHQVELSIFHPDKRSVKFNYKKSDFDPLDVHRLLLAKDMLLNLLATDKVKFLVEPVNTTNLSLF